jgi:hypothetical protein
VGCFEQRASQVGRDKNDAKHKNRSQQRNQALESHPFKHALNEYRRAGSACISFAGADSRRGMGEGTTKLRTR